MNRLPVLGCLLFCISSMAFSYSEIYFPELDPVKEIPAKPIKREEIRNFKLTGEQSKQVKQLNSTVISYYDKYNNELESMRDYFDDKGNKTDAQKWKYIYEGTFLTSFTINYSEDVFESGNCFYDSNKRMKPVIYKNNFSQEYSDVSSKKDTLKYDSENRLVEVESLMGNGHFIISKFSYDDYGNMEESTIYDEIGNIRDRDAYIYKNGVLSKSTFEEYVTSYDENNPYTKIEAEYDVNRRVIKEISEIKNVNNTESQIQIYIYRYKNNFLGDWIEKSKFKYYSNGITEKLILSEMATRDMKYW